MPSQNSAKAAIDAGYPRHAKVNGTFALSALELKEGDTLVLAQLGDPCLPKDAFEKLPGGIEVINLDFLEFAETQKTGTPHEWENDPDWPCEYPKVGTWKTFRDFANNLPELAKKPSGTVKCFFDVSDYPLGELAPISPYMKKKRFSRYGESSPDRLDSSCNWSAIDGFVSELIRSVDPAQMNCANEWGPLLYVALANLICNNGLSATILPEAYLKDKRYIQARNEFARSGFIRSVVYLGRTNSVQDYPVLLLTSKARNTGKILCTYALLSEKTQKRIKEVLGLESLDAAPAAAADALLHGAWGKEEADRIGLSQNWKNWRFGLNAQLLFQNEARLDSQISDFYRSYRGYEAKLRNVADRVRSYSSTIGRQANYKKPLAKSAESLPSVEGADEDKETFRYTFLPQSLGDSNRDVLMDKKLPEEHCLIPGDILISRIVRSADERGSSGTSSPKIMCVMEESHDGTKRLCPSSYICIRPKAGSSLCYSLTLAHYLMYGHGKLVLDAIVKMQNGSLTWDALSEIELPPSLVYGSKEWRELETKIKDATDSYLDARQKSMEAYKAEVSSKRKLVDEFLEAFK